MKKQIKIQYNGGAAMMIFVFFFMFISLTVLIGIVTPVVREFKIASDSLMSKQTYFLSESGVEDAMYRLKNSKQIGSTETIVLGSTTATTTITNLTGGQKEISTLSDTNSHQRKVDLVLSTAAGVSFSYGILVGGGGLYLDSGIINGNVYSNGPITASSSGSNKISGTAISANSPSLVADQTNGSGVPPYNVTFGNANGTQDITQSFQVATSNSPLNKIQLYIKKTGSPSNATVKIMNDSNGSPGATVLDSGTLSASSVTTSYGWIDVSFTNNSILNVGTTYWLVVDASTSSSKYYIIGASSATYANGLGKIGQLGTSWSSTSPAGLDYFFSIYLGGINGLIAGDGQYNPLHIGTTSGTAQAHTVNSVNSTGNIYCQTGTYNNKSCTAQADPTYVAYPVSDANITQWETDAEAGGTYNGNYSVGWAGATLGPKKIVGNLTVSGGGILTVTGTLWVTGEIVLNGGGTIKLSSSYGANDGVLVSDGDLEVSGGGHATGSGTTGSYIMLLSTSSSSSAATVNGGAGAVIVYAPNGTVNISGGASLKEATGYAMTVSGGSSISYESGLTNNNFSSGPSGTWNISSWKEVQ